MPVAYEKYNPLPRELRRLQAVYREEPELAEMYMDYIRLSPKDQVEVKPLFYFLETQFEQMLARQNQHPPAPAEKAIQPAQAALTQRSSVALATYSAPSAIKKPPTVDQPFLSRDARLVWEWACRHGKNGEALTRCRLRQKLAPQIPYTWDLERAVMELVTLGLMRTVGVYGKRRPDCFALTETGQYWAGEAAKRI